ncbi:MAG: anhydro-N-acetylmuramic acid kinase [Thiobacillus sp.]
MISDSLDEAELYIGLMSGTSLDGIDAVLAEITPDQTRLVSHHYLSYPSELRLQLLNLHSPQHDEIHLAMLSGQQLAHLYANAVEGLLKQAVPDKAHIRAIGCHGQTLRHRPESGYTIQIGNAALLAELTRVTVVADFRSRDIAAGGQGAPLVPAFHAQVLRHPTLYRVIVNIGGVTNITDLPPAGPVRGWDTGPGNMLLDAWVHQHEGAIYDKAGAWAARGKVNALLLNKLLSHDFLNLHPPKSAGREQFNLDYLQTLLSTLPGPIGPVDVQATLLEFTAQSLCDAIKKEGSGVQEVYICGGGVHNDALMQRIAALLAPVPVRSTGTAGVDPDWMEALAFAWLARQTMHDLPGNLPEATGARGPRILGAIYPA